MEDGCNNTMMDIIKKLTELSSKLQSENEILKEKVKKLTEENKELRQEATGSTYVARRLDKHNDSPDDSADLTERKQVYSSTATPDKVPSFVLSPLSDIPKPEHHVKGEITSTINALRENGPPAFNFQSTVSGRSASWLSRMTTQLFNSTYDVEIHMHHSLRRAVSKYCEELALNGYGFIDNELLDYLLQEGCITHEEYHLCRQPNINVMRVLVLKMLRRDCKTLASFVGVQLECIGFKHIGEAIISQYEEYVREPQQSIHTEEHCCHCLLRNQVDICLIIDKLLRHDYRAWISLYEKVSLSGNAERNQKFWDEFMALTNECGQSFILSERLIDWLSGIGFHSDIVRKLRRDLQEGCNSFLCKHLTHRKIPASVSNSLVPNLKNNPSDSEETENTTCKQVISENTAHKQLLYENKSCENEDHDEENTTCKQLHEKLDITTPKCIDTQTQTVKKGENGPIVPQNVSNIGRRIGFESAGSNPTAYQALPYIMISDQVQNDEESEKTNRFKELKIYRNEDYDEENTTCKQIHEKLDITTPKCIDAETQTGVKDEEDKGENGPIVPQNVSNIGSRTGFESAGSNPTAFEALPYIMISDQVQNDEESEKTNRFCELKELKICRNEDSERTVCKKNGFKNTAIENEDLGVTTYEYEHLENQACENEDTEYSACGKVNLENTACKNVDSENTLPKCVYEGSESSIVNIEDTERLPSMNTPEGDALIVLISFSIAYHAISYILINDTP